MSEGADQRHRARGPSRWSARRPGGRRAASRDRLELFLNPPGRCCEPRNSGSGTCSASRRRSTREHPLLDLRRSTSTSTRPSRCRSRPDRAGGGHVPVPGRDRQPVTLEPKTSGWLRRSIEQGFLFQGTPAYEADQGGMRLHAEDRGARQAGVRGHPDYDTPELRHHGRHPAADPGHRREPEAALATAATAGSSPRDRSCGSCTGTRASGSSWAPRRCCSCPATNR